MTMIAVEDSTTITSEIQTRQLVDGTTMITLLLSIQQIIITFWFGEIISEAIYLFVLFDRCQGCISFISLLVFNTENTNLTYTEEVLANLK